MIEITGLLVKLNDTIILNNHKYDFQESMIHGIVGLNGAGKTTFFNTVSGVIKPNSGTIARNKKLISYSEIGYLESVNFFYSRLTGYEYLNIFSRSNSDFKLEAFNQLTNLPLSNLIETYSTGMKKKLAMLSIIKQDKPIYLLDEPFNSLDIESVKVMEMVIQNFKSKQKTVFISSHIIETLVPVCDQIHLLENGIFKKAFDKWEFSSIEEALLGHFKQTAERIIGESM